MPDLALWMLPALQADPVVKPKIITVPGWASSYRPGAFFPSGIVEHHTACMCRVGHDPQSCINGIIAGNTVAPGPISQLLVTATRPGVKWTGKNLDPHVILIAAGRSNHAGVGSYVWGAPAGNGSSIGIEGCGPFEDWPDGLIDFRGRVSTALLRNRGWHVGQVTTHFEYATPRGRKIDPSGAWDAEPFNGLYDPWNASMWRLRLSEYLSPPIPPDPGPGPDPGIVLKLGDIIMTDERRIYDSRTAGNRLPAALFAVPTGVDPVKHSAVMVNVTAIAQARPGYMSVNASTSFNNFQPWQVVDNARPFPLQPDGTILMGANDGGNGQPTPIHVLVDLIGVYPRVS